MGGINNPHMVDDAYIYICILYLYMHTYVCLYVWNGMEWNGMEWSGVEWSGVEWNGVEWSGVEWSVCMSVCIYTYIYVDGSRPMKFPYD